MRIIFAGTPELAATHLQALIQSSHEVIAVFTQPDRPAGRGQKLTASPVKVLAEQYQIPIFQPKTLKDPEIQAQIQTMQADIMVVVAYGLILPAAVLAIPKYGCINVHVSLLPRWRGAAPVQHAVLAGDQQTGVTIMQMDVGLDTGDILYQISCDILAEDNTVSVYDKITQLGPDALLATLEQLETNKLQRQKQNHDLATYAHKINKVDAEINWQESAIMIDRKIRGYYSWPVAYTHFNGQTIRIWRAKISKEETENISPGQIIELSKDKLIVACGKGALSLEILQLPGGKPLTIREILQANKAGFKLGAILNGAE